MRRIILFDGICNLCNSSVNFIIKRDRMKNFQFASLQSQSAKRLLEEFDINITSQMNSLLVIEGESLYKYSDAVLIISRQLDGVWPFVYLLRIIPRFIRDNLYKYIAKYRYQWFGRQDSCMLPNPQIESRFLNDND